MVDKMLVRFIVGFSIVLDGLDVVDWIIFVVDWMFFLVEFFLVVDGFEVDFLVLYNLFW